MQFGKQNNHKHRQVDRRLEVRWFSKNRSNSERYTQELYIRLKHTSVYYAMYEVLEHFHLSTYEYTWDQDQTTEQFHCNRDTLLLKSHVVHNQQSNHIRQGHQWQILFAHLQHRDEHEEPHSGNHTSLEV